MLACGVEIKMWRGGSGVATGVVGRTLGEVYTYPTSALAEIHLSAAYSG